MSQPKDATEHSGSTDCSSRRSWTEMEKYASRKFRGTDPQDGKRKTIKVVDSTIGGDVYIHRRSHGEETWEQNRFLKFVTGAKELPV